VAAGRGGKGGVVTAPASPASSNGQAPEKGDRVEFVFVCGWCGAENYFVGKQVGWWVDKWEVPSEWDCHNCDGSNTTPYPPWTKA
jgi:hypothetical protein